ncbi:acyltransferase 3 [Thiorhodococcus drewsii AZ1]|uniref:Acyltransferase 3 n=1 Tax=Thiorhodococcus drewsii AZ1 TaxID=765913 RepID=G2E602_9GAMM|nr:acyltransferase [Thiorhodococcus drewsii]EGV28487.1 acyltransferase 3 [Thiorhodococcus drewsii AZ1]
MAVFDIDRPLGSGSGSAVYIPYLDGLRAVAVLIVLVSHFNYSHRVPGDLGVTIFFVISGFIITRVIFRQTTGHLGGREIIGFYLRRIFRLMPALLAYLLAMMVFDVCVGSPVDGVQYFAALIYQYNYAVHLFDIHQSRWFGHLWSLAVEEHFYLFFPWLLYFFGFGRRGFLVTLLITVFAAFWQIGLVQFAQNKDSLFLTAEHVYIRSDTRIASILIGVVLTLLTLSTIPTWLSQINRFGFLIIGVGIALILAPIVVSPTVHAGDGFGLVLQSLGVAIAMNGILFGQDSGRLRKALSYAPLVWLGKISYSLYIWHVAIYWRIVSPMGIDSDALRFLTGLVLSVAVASVSYYWVESPIRSQGHAWTDRLFPTRRTSRSYATT